MTKLNELINELCPDGVEYRTLGTVCKIEKGIQFNKENMNDVGTYPVINGGINPSGYIEQFNQVENSITISQGGASAGYVNWIKTKFWAGAHCYILKPFSEFVLNRYVYHFLKQNEFKLQECQYGAGIPALSKSTIESLKIPVPPLPVQEEIVRILDKFTSLEAELEAELEARKKQYEFYRDRLLTFGDVRGGATSDVVWRTLGDICKKVVSGGTPQAGNPEYYGGTIPWLRTQEVDWKDITDTVVKITEAGLNASSAKWIPENCVIVAMYGATAAKVAINKIPLTTNQACCNLEIDENQALYRYVFHWLCKEYLSLKALGQGSQSNINAQTIKQYKIPIPSLEIQNKIVNVLDNFDAICSDLNIGLPAEIEARKKQYEFYRDALLTYAATGRTILTDRQTSIVR